MYLAPNEHAYPSAIDHQPRPSPLQRQIRRALIFYQRYSLIELGMVEQWLSSGTGDGLQRLEKNLCLLSGIYHGASCRCSRLPSIGGNNLTFGGQVVFVIVLLVFSTHLNSPTHHEISEWKACDRPLGVWNCLWVARVFLACGLSYWGWCRERNKYALLPDDDTYILCTDLPEVVLMKAMLNQPRVEPPRPLRELVHQELALELQQIFRSEMPFRRRHRPIHLGYLKVKEPPAPNLMLNYTPGE